MVQDDAQIRPVSDDCENIYIVCKEEEHSKKVGKREKGPNLKGQELAKRSKVR